MSGLADELLSLAARCEAAHEPSMVLDGDIWRVLNGWPESDGQRLESGAWHRIDDGVALEPPPAFTSSFAAARIVVPPDMVWNIGNDVGSWAHVWLDDEDYDGVPYQGRAANEEMALCAAALAARADRAPRVLEAAND